MTGFDPFQCQVNCHFCAVLGQYGPSPYSAIRERLLTVCGTPALTAMAGPGDS